MCCGKILKLNGELEKSQKRRISRRRFVKTLGLGAATMALSGCSQSLERLAGLGVRKSSSGVTPLATLDDAVAAALVNPQVQELKARLEGRGHRLNANAAKGLEFGLDAEKGIYISIPFEPLAEVAYIQAQGVETASGNVDHKRFGKLVMLEPGQDDYEIGLTPAHKRQKALKLCESIQSTKS